ncbi:MAG: polysaccharide biosynthesis/export family protein [Pseudomonadota bacterium]
MNNYNNRKQSCALAIAAVSVLIGGCASTPEPVIGAAVITPRADLGQADYTFKAPQTYSLRAGDIVSINVFREPDFSLESVRVGVDGIVSMPMLGGVKISGMTTSQVEALLNDRLGVVGLKNPRVAVNISEYASHLVTVEGGVERPGVYPFQPGARLSTAVALASGPRREANTEQVAVFRTRDDGVYIAKFDYGAISQGTMLDPVLEPNDRVVIGVDGLSLFYQDLLKALPAFGVFANVAINASN